MHMNHDVIYKGGGVSWEKKSIIMLYKMGDKRKGEYDGIT